MRGHRQRGEKRERRERPPRQPRGASRHGNNTTSAAAAADDVDFDDDDASVLTSATESSTTPFAATTAATTTTGGGGGGYSTTTATGGAAVAFASAPPLPMQYYYNNNNNNNNGPMVLGGGGATANGGSSALGMPIIPSASTAPPPTSPLVGLLVPQTPFGVMPASPQFYQHPQPFNQIPQPFTQPPQAFPSTGYTPVMSTTSSPTAFAMPPASAMASASHKKSNKVCAACGGPVVTRSNPKFGVKPKFSLCHTCIASRKMVRCSTCNELKAWSQLAITDKNRCSMMLETATEGIVMKMRSGTVFCTECAKGPVSGSATFPPALQHPIPPPVLATTTVQTPCLVPNVVQQPPFFGSTVAQTPMVATNTVQPQMFPTTTAATPFFARTEVQAPVVNPRVCAACTQAFPEPLDLIGQCPLCQQCKSKQVVMKCSECRGFKPLLDFDRKVLNKILEATIEKSSVALPGLGAFELVATFHQQSASCQQCCSRGRGDRGERGGRASLGVCLECGKPRVKDPSLQYCNPCARKKGMLPLKASRRGARGGNKVTVSTISTAASSVASTAPPTGATTPTTSTNTVTKAPEPSAQVCVVCWQGTATFLAVPCGHLCLCEACATQLQSSKGECPVCRGKAQQFIKVFNSGVDL
ncbi:hypothetical protein Pelo_13545 [Pelomyxa schiedti]|nr:hypothetical protein Pelo_13545 [Pelomyxa schiedti]